MTQVAYLPHPAADLLEPFLDAQMRPTTRRAYRSDLIGFFGTNLITVDQVQSLTIEEVERYRNELAEEGVKPSTINRKLTSLRGFLRRCVAKGIIDRSPADPALVKNYKNLLQSNPKFVGFDCSKFLTTVTIV